MKRLNHFFFEKIELKNFLDLKSFLGGSSSNRLNRIKGFLLGFRKGSVVFDIEKSLTTYLKVLRLVTACKESSSQILFVGCPPQIESVVRKKLNNSRHIFISESSWVLGSLTNSSQSELFPNLIITFNLNRTFPSRECFKKEIPLVSFIDDACDFSFIDYPIFINLKSDGASNMYYNLINQSI